MARIKGKFRVKCKNVLSNKQEGFFIINWEVTKGREKGRNIYYFISGLVETKEKEHICSLLNLPTLPRRKEILCQRLKELGEINLQIKEEKRKDEN